MLLQTKGFEVRMRWKIIAYLEGPHILNGNASIKITIGRIICKGKSLLIEEGNPKYISQE